MQSVAIRKLCVPSSINQLTTVRAAQVYPFVQGVEIHFISSHSTSIIGLLILTPLPGHYLRGCCSHRHNSILRCLPWCSGHSAKVKHKYHIIFIAIGRALSLSRVWWWRRASDKSKLPAEATFNKWNLTTKRWCN